MGTRCRREGGPFATLLPKRSRTPDGTDAPGGVRGQHSTSGLNRTEVHSTHTGGNTELWLPTLGDAAVEDSVTCVVSDPQPPSIEIPSREQLIARGNWCRSQALPSAALVNPGIIEC